MIFKATAININGNASIAVETHRCKPKITNDNIKISAESLYQRCHWCKANSNSISFKLGASMKYVTIINNGPYLKIDKDVLWVTPEVWEQLMIMSNVEWEII